jgi:AcrR family transcriptional regulator
MAASPGTSTATRVLPRGRNAAPRRVVRESQRERMLEAMAVAVSEKGYGDVAVADVIAGAGVSRKTFYEQFANKEACFLAAYDAGVARLADAIEEAIAAAPDWLQAVRGGVGCYLQALADNPAFARTFLIEIHAAGPVALEREAAVHDGFAQLIATAHAAARADLPDLPEVPAYTFRAYVGAVKELVTDEMRQRGPEALPSLLEALLEIQFALYAGAPFAQQILQASDTAPIGT